MIKVFLLGEGRNELGGWSREPQHRDEQPFTGVLEALARRLVPSGWEVHDALRWKDVRKLAVGTTGKGADRKAMLAAHLYAKERGCDAIVFSRDRDGRKNGVREQEIEQALAELEAEADGIPMAGAVCVERLESWVLAVSGRTNTEELRGSRIDEELAAIGIPPKDTQGMLEVIERHGLSAVPPDAASLRVWIERVRAALEPSSSG